MGAGGRRWDELISWNGTEWSRRTTSVSDVWGSESPLVLWAVGRDGIQFYDGVAWTTYESDWKPISIAGVDKNNIWALESSRLLYYDGVTWQWSSLALPFDTQASEIDSDGHFIVASSGGVIARSKVPAIQLE